MTIFVDKDSGQKIDVPDEPGKIAEAKTAGLVPLEADQRSGGLLNALRTVPESAVAAASETFAGLAEGASKGIQKLTGFGSAPGLVDSESGPITGEKIGPAFAFSEGAKERREMNPTAATIGASLPDVAATALMPEAEGASLLGKAASLVGRSAVTGALAEGQQVATEGGQYSLGDAAMFGLTAGTLEVGGKYALRQAMNAVGAVKDALGGAVQKAVKFATDDALSEPEDFLRVMKQAGNADQILADQQTKLVDALGDIDVRMNEAADKIFSKSALQKSVSSNLQAQEDHFLDLAIQLQHAADVSGSTQVAAAKDLLQGAIGEGGPNMFRSLREARGLLEGADLSESQLGRDAFDALDDSLRNDGIWGKAAKNYSTLADHATAANAEARQAFHLDAAETRPALDAHLDAALGVAKTTGDKQLSAAVEAARKLTNDADQVIGARTMRETAIDNLTDKASKKLAGGAVKLAAGAVGGGHGGPLGAIGGYHAAKEFLAEPAADLLRPAVRRGVAGLVDMAASRAGSLAGGAAEQAGSSLAGQLAGRAAPAIGALALGGHTAAGADATDAESSAPTPDAPPDPAAAGPNAFEKDDLEDQARQQARNQQTLTQLEYLKAQGQNAINTTARALANPAQNARTVPRTPGLTNSTGIKGFLGTQKDLRGAFNEKRDSLEKLERDPMLLVDEMTDSLGSLQDAAPDLHRQVVAQTYKVASYLKDKMPGTIGATLTRPDGAPPNPLALRQFALYYSAATDPSTVLADLTHNRAQREQVDTLRDLYPDTYGQLKSALLDQMAQGKPPSFQQRQRLDLLFDFGPSLDAALSPRLGAALDAFKQSPKGQGKGDGQGKPSPVMPSRRTQPSIEAIGALSSLALGASKAA